MESSLMVLTVSEKVYQKLHDKKRDWLCYPVTPNTHAKMAAIFQWPSRDSLPDPEQEGDVIIRSYTNRFHKCYAKCKCRIGRGSVNEGFTDDGDHFILTITAVGPDIV